MLFSLMSNLQIYNPFQLDFQNVDQHAGGKWLILRTKRRKDNQLQSLELENITDFYSDILQCD